ncbi:NADH:flavin oxidoreductase [Rhizorhabdus sp.]|uniref:NADH:flavin oxidoreductase n=1 Tax=Rhizorhabdus sp. TaxID=1968843 RepID=UPI00198B0010|nr:NADH:flavin oxidoreductase [Rhizorhabdus sp.]MBD3761655.1 NADH:flavin oxidoreductase [Rhizorhabdus sp.]
MNDDHINALFEPFELKSLKLKNRLTMSPMTRYFSPDGIPTGEVAAYYTRRAHGGVGLIISEGAFTDREISRNVSTVPSFYGDALEPWKKVVSDVHKAGAAMAPQLWHVGGARDFNYADDPLGDVLESPSGLIGPNLAGGQEMSDDDIAAAVSSFVRGAVDAKRLGFDAVEFHGAHGYLFDQFFWGETNKRTGPFGGASLPERTRFAAEVVRQTRAAVGEDFTIIFRMSQWKAGFYDVKLAQTPAELEAWLRPLVDAGVDIFDCSQRRFWEPEFEGSPLNLAGWVKKLTGRATITVGSIGLSTDLYKDFETRAISAPTPSTIRDVAERLDRGEFDLVAIGRALLADAEWPLKVRERRWQELRGYSVDLMGTLV